MIVTIVVTVFQTGKLRPGVMQYFVQVRCQEVVGPSFKSREPGSPNVLCVRGKKVPE